MKLKLGKVYGSFLALFLPHFYKPKLFQNKNNKKAIDDSNKLLKKSLTFSPSVHISKVSLIFICYSFSVNIVVRIVKKKKNSVISVEISQEPQIFKSIHHISEKAPTRICGRNISY